MVRKEVQIIFTKVVDIRSISLYDIRVAAVTRRNQLYSGDSEKDPPVPISNTAVKLLSAEDSEGFPFVKAGRCYAVFNGGLAQLGEHLPYKQRVSGSSPLTSIDP